MKQFKFKVFLVLFVVGLSSHPVFAQVKKPGLLIGANINYTAPKGNFARDFKGGPGAEITGGVGMGKTYLVATLGYSYLIDRGSAETSNLTYKPVKIGVRQYILAKRVFVNADIGRATIKNKSKGTTESALTRGVGAGFRLFGLETALYYDGFKNKNSGGFSNSLQYKLGWNITL